MTSLTYTANLGEHPLGTPMPVPPHCSSSECPAKLTKEAGLGNSEEWDSWAVIQTKLLFVECILSAVVKKSTDSATYWLSDLGRLLYLSVL